MTKASKITAWPWRKFSITQEKVLHGVAIKLRYQGAPLKKYETFLQNIKPISNSQSQSFILALASTTSSMSSGKDEKKSYPVIRSTSSTVLTN